MMQGFRYAMRSTTLVGIRHNTLRCSMTKTLTLTTA
jgi:hypothetical protein